MIVRDKPRLLDVLFTIKGSILPRIIGPLLFMLVLSVVAILVAHVRPRLLADLAVMPFTLLGLSLSIFMSFRNTACYNRWWEGRQLWGQLIIACRSLARQTADLAPAEREPMLIGLCGFVHGLAARLRSGDEAGAIAAQIGPGAWEAALNPTDAALNRVGRMCLALKASGRIDSIHYSVLEGTLSEIARVQGGCERIKNTPLPFPYSLLLHRTAYAFCVMLPFALAPKLGDWTPVPTLLVSFAFFGLDALGDELSDPFGDDPNDLPLNAMARMIEREMLDAIGRTDLPPPVAPRDWVLL